MESTTHDKAQYSDETLCTLAASGDRIAEEVLVLRYNRLVRICARPFFLTGGDSDDLIQEMCIRDSIQAADSSVRGEWSVLNHLSGYEDWLKFEKKASANTLSSYLRDVRQFSAWLEGQDLDVSQATQGDIKSYVKYLRARGKSEATVVRSVASLKSFYSYLVACQVLSVNPAKGYTPSKIERKLPQILTSKEVDLFLEQPDGSDAKGCRDKAMLELLYATGIRVSELIALDVQALSRQMTLFFRRYLNGILAQPYEGYESMAVAIVYAGGDDVFLAGYLVKVMEFYF